MRVLNCISAAMLFAFQIWFVIDLFIHHNFWGVLLRIWAPIFIMYQNNKKECWQLWLFQQNSNINVLLRTSSSCNGYQELFCSIYCTFYFMQYGIYFGFWVQHCQPCVLFEIFRVSIVLSCLFIALSMVFSIVACVKPPGSNGLLSEDIGISVWVLKHIYWFQNSLKCYLFVQNHKF